MLQCVDGAADLEFRGKEISAVAVRLLEDFQSRADTLAVAICNNSVF